MWLLSKEKERKLRDQESNKTIYLLFKFYGDYSLRLLSTEPHCIFICQFLVLHLYLQKGGPQLSPIYCIYDTNQLTTKSHKKNMQVQYIHFLLLLWLGGWNWLLKMHGDCSCSVALEQKSLHLFELIFNSRNQKLKGRTEKCGIRNAYFTAYIKTRHKALFQGKPCFIHQTFSPDFFHQGDE